MRDREWTTLHGRSNSSALYNEICSEVEQLIRDDATKLLAGRADLTARLIVATLAHQYGLAPSTEKMRP